MNSPVSEPIDELAAMSPDLMTVAVSVLVHPDEPPSIRAVEERTGLPEASVRHQIRQLEQHGLLVEAGNGEDGGRKPDFRHPGWTRLVETIRDTVPPEDVLRPALTGVDEPVEVAFIYGSVARGTERPDSDLDLFVVAHRRERRVLARGLMEAGAVLGRAVNLTLYQRQELEKAWSSPTAYLQSVLTGEKRWVMGDEETLGKMLTELSGA